MDLAAALLTGLGLAAAAGLNAYIPLVIVGFLQWTDWLDFPEPYDQLGNPYVLTVLVVLLVVEVLADKIPVVDSANDVIQTVVRPVAGAVLFAASTGVVGDVPPWLALVAGIVTAGTVHGTKAAIRPIANAGSAGTAAPVISTVEDVMSFALTGIALLAPLLVLVAVIGFIVMVVRWRRGRRERAAVAG